MYRSMKVRSIICLRYFMASSKTGNGEWRNGEWGTGNGERGTGNGEQGISKRGNL